MSLDDLGNPSLHTTWSQARGRQLVTPFVLDRDRLVIAGVDRRLGLLWGHPFRPSDIV